MADISPSLDRPAVSRPAVTCGKLLGEALDLSAYRLAGGTALAWALGHRRSDDLDFFTRQAGVLDSLEQGHLAGQLQALDSGAVVQMSGERTIHATVHGCKVSFFEIDGRWLHPPVVVAEGLCLASVDDVAAMKIVSVLTRSAKKDFYDLHALTHLGYDARKLYDFARAAQPKIDAEVAAILVRALIDFSDAELDPDPIVLDGATWDAVRRSAEKLSLDLQGLLRQDML